VLIDKFLDNPSRRGRRHRRRRDALCRVMEHIELAASIGDSLRIRHQLAPDIDTIAKHPPHRHRAERVG